VNDGEVGQRLSRQLPASAADRPDVPALPHGAVQTDIDVDKRIRGPQQLAKLVALTTSPGRSRSARTIWKDWSGKRDLEAVPTKLSRSDLELE
jgi:hypothetical protein